MDLVTFLRVLLRRWDVVVPGLVLTFVVVIAAGSSVSAEYEAEASLLLLGPSTSTSSQGAVAVNPYLNNPEKLDATAVIIDRSMSSEEIKRELANLGATADYELTPTEKTPILTVTARGSSRDQVLHTSQLVLERVQGDLVRRQLEAGAPEHTWIRTEILSTPQVSMNTGNKPRVMAAVGALGLGITVMLAFMVESLAAWLPRRLRAATAPTGPTVAGFPFVPSEPAPHMSAAGEVAQGNGWHPHPPAGPPSDVVVGPADHSSQEDPFEGMAVEGPRADNEVSANHASTNNGSHEEQQDELVDAWWSAWERRQAVRRGTQDAATPDRVDREREPPSDSDGEAEPIWDEDLRDAVDQTDHAETVVGWGDRIEVLGGPSRAQRGAPDPWAFETGGDDFAEGPGT
ncbi:MAG: hypothetical protein M3O70_22670 [Actinomycetota bacterium]|nr:hypothetical protein [Actinomycetota bacterium]